MSEEKRTQFDYLLNAVDLALQHADPASQDYAGKRKALFRYVRELERVALSRTSWNDRIERIERRVSELESVASPSVTS
jgi:hypothetical protein